MKQEKKSRGRRVQDILCFFCSFPYFDRKKALMREEIRKNDRSNKKKSKFVTKELLFALEKKTYTSMMAPPGALFLSFSRFLRAFFSTGLESAYSPCVCRFASRFADGISKILSFFSLSFSLARRLSGRFLFSLLFLSLRV